MVLEATDEETYELMDLRDRHLLTAAVSALVSAICVYVVVLIRANFETVYLLAASFLCMVFFLRLGILEGKKVMEAKGCYLKLDEDSVTVRQIKRSGHYEYCRIYLDEIEKIVEGGRRGIPEFYVVIEENALKSFLLLDKEKMPGRIFWIRSFGYSFENFQNFYRKFCWEAPGKARIIGTDKQEVWEMKKPKQELLFAVSLLVLYLIPKILMTELGVGI
ncbi:MAG: hypothetical protein LUI87_16140 [Lachnospiraceae bacterium]|nr:hypothetical protein [Lachnospiraceae bacterium]